MYAIKVYLNKPKKSGLATKGNPFMQDALAKNYYLMRDLEDNVVHVYTRKERAEKTATQLQEQNPGMLIMITEDIPKEALARALKKKADEKTSETNKSNSKSG